MRESQVLQNSDKMYFLREKGEANRSRAPISTFFHMFFKIATLFSYFLVPMFSKSKILSYILSIVFSSFDFWVVKNVSGRYLVGLRWWSEIDKDDKEIWMFECRSDEKDVKPIDSRMFWTSQIVFTAFWGIWFAIHLLSFKFLRTITLFIAFLLLAMNLYAFFKCSKVQKERVNEIMDDIKNKGMNMAMEKMKASVKMPLGMRVL